jgi:type I restriction enzyme S subunit
VTTVRLPWIKLRRVRDVRTGYSFFADGDVAFAKVTPCFENGKGAVMHGLTGGLGFGTTELTVLRPRVSKTERYLYFLTQEHRFQQLGRAAMTGAGGLKRVPDRFTANFPVAVPSIDEQRRIADFLDREIADIDELIAKQNALIEILGERRKAVITRAVSAGSDIAGVSSGGWSLVPLKRVIRGWSSGTSVNAADTPAEAGEVGVLKTSCVSAGQFDPSQNKVVVAEEVDRVTCPVRRNTLIVNRANTPLLVGSAGLVRNAPANLFLSDKLWQIEFKGATPSFIYYWTITDLYRSQLSAIRVGASASMQNISFEDFRALLVALPSIADQNRITQYLDVQVATIDALVQKAQGFIKVGRERRSALITAAVTGKIDVRERVS